MFMRRKWTGNGVRFSILSALNIFYIIVKMFGADGYVSNFEFSSKKNRDDFLFNTTNYNKTKWIRKSLLFIKFVFVLPMQKTGMN